MVLFSGDGDFRPLVEALHVRESPWFNIASQPPMIADEVAPGRRVHRSRGAEVEGQPERVAPTRAHPEFAGEIAFPAKLLIRP
jgi:hypothetical protein